DAVCLSPAEAVRSLLSLAGEGPPGVEMGDDVRFWTIAARLSLEKLYRQRLLPFLERSGDGYIAGWRPLLDQDRDRVRLEALSRSMPPACRALAWTSAGAPPEYGAAALLDGFVAAAADSLAREAISARIRGATKWSGAKRGQAR